jgi:hypothetical protein
MFRSYCAKYLEKEARERKPLAVGTDVAIAIVIVCKPIFEERAGARVMISLSHNQHLTSTVPRFQGRGSMVAAVCQCDGYWCSCDAGFSPNGVSRWRCLANCVSCPDDSGGFHRSVFSHPEIVICHVESVIPVIREERETGVRQRGIGGVDES